MQIREHLGTGKPAIILYPTGTVVTFDDLEARANRLAHYFRAQGLREGDVVAILMENNEHFHAVMWAARRSGLYYVPINTHLTSAEAAYIIDNSGAKAIIGSAALRKTCARPGRRAAVGSSRRAADRRRRPGRLGALPGMRCRSTRYPHRRRVGGRSAAVLVGHHGPAEGHQAGAARTSPPSEAPGMMSALVGFWMHPDAVYLSPAPLYHTAPSVWSMNMQAAGVTTVVMEKFDAEGCLDAIARHRVTHGQFVPAMFTRMLKLPEDVRNSYDVSSLERVIHAAAPCPVEIKKQMIDWWGPIVDEYYASSEAHGSTLISAEDWLDASRLGRQGETWRRAHPRRGGQRAAARAGRRDLLRGRPFVRVPQRPGEDGVVAGTPAGG